MLNGVAVPLDRGLDGEVPLAQSQQGGAGVLELSAAVESGGEQRAFGFQRPYGRQQPFAQPEAQVLLELRPSLRRRDGVEVGELGDRAAPVRELRSQLPALAHQSWWAPGLIVSVGALGVPEVSAAASANGKANVRVNPGAGSFAAVLSASCEAGSSFASWVFSCSRT